VEPVRIDDPDHSLLDAVRSLRGPDRHLRRQGLVVVEGFTIVERLLRRGVPIRQVVVTASTWDRLGPLLTERHVPTVLVDRTTLATAAGFDVHRGVLALLDEPAPASWDTVARTARTVVVVEALNDAENLGALMRSAWALGVDAVVLDPTTLDPYGRRVVRVSMGAVLDLPIVRAGVWPEALDDLRHRGLQLVGLTPRHDAVTLARWTVTSHERVAILVGAEGPGLSAAALDRVDTALRIPMRPGVDSLNVAHAAAIVLAALDRAPTITS
jgi:tRNA G18 (ribose-2'-O)-methylase SpoU